MLLLSFLKFFIKCIFKSCILALVVPSMFFLLGATTDALSSVFITILLTILPWFIWMQYLIDINISTAFQPVLSFFSMFGRMCTSVIFLMTMLPYVPSSEYVNFKNIVPELKLSKQSAAITKFGSLYLGSSDFLPKQTKALWISSNNLAFRYIETNHLSLILEQAYVLDQNGYSLQKNTELKIPFAEPRNIIFNSGYGANFFLWWLEKAMLFSFELKAFSQTLNLSVNKIDCFFQRQDFSLKTEKPNSPMFSENASKSLDNRNILSTNNQYYNYVVLFLYLSILFFVGSIVCILLSLGQPLLNILSFSVLTAIAGTFYISWFFSVVELFLKYLPFLPLWLGLFIILLVEICILYLVLFLRKKIQRQFL